MASGNLNSNTTLTSLWVEESAPVKSVNIVPTNVIKNEIKEDFMNFYKESGLEPAAKDVGILDPNGELTKFQQQNIPPQVPNPVQMVTIPYSPSPSKSPFRVESQQFNPRAATTLISGQTIVSATTSPIVIGTPQRVVAASNQIILASPQTPFVATPVHVESPSVWSSGQKRNRDCSDTDFYPDSAVKRKRSEKGGKGLRHFSMKVCEKVQKKGVTSYNEVADELVTEFTDPLSTTATDQKNIRRRVYDALNVLMAMNIIQKEKKEIRWIGLPTNSAQEYNNLELEKQKRIDRIKQKQQQLQELILQQIAFKNLVQRNRQNEMMNGSPAPNSAIHLPFIIVNTSKKTVIDCSISNDKYEYLFNFDNTFEIHDDIEVLKRMGLAYNLEKGECSEAELKKAAKLLPKSLEPYVLEMATSHNNKTQNYFSSCTPLKVKNELASSPLAVPLSVNTVDSSDYEVATATGSLTSRHSSMASFDDLSGHGTPFSESESDRSSPTEF